MKRTAYPVVLIEDTGGYIVKIPDFGIATEGDSIADAIWMARDAIGLMGIEMQDEGEELPIPGQTAIEDNNGMITMVDIDFDDYRKKYENKSVRKNVSIPYWMSERADREDINLSRVLQEALANLFGMKQNNIN